MPVCRRRTIQVRFCADISPQLHKYNFPLPPDVMSMSDTLWHQGRGRKLFAYYTTLSWGHQHVRHPGPQESAASLELPTPLFDTLLQNQVTPVFFLSFFLSFFLFLFFTVTLCVLSHHPPATCVCSVSVFNFVMTGQNWTPS